MKRGEIWHAEIPGSNGHEQSGSRPVVIWSKVEANIVIILPFTSNLQALKYPNALKISPSKNNGLKPVP